MTIDINKFGTFFIHRGIDGGYLIDRNMINQTIPSGIVEWIINAYGFLVVRNQYMTLEEFAQAIKNYSDHPKSKFAVKTLQSGK